MAFLKYSFSLALLSGLALSFIIEPNCNIKPLDLDGNYSSIMGSWNLVVGASKGDLVGSFLIMIKSLWMELSPGPNSNTLLSRQVSRFSFFDICTSTTSNYTFKTGNPLHQSNNSENDSVYLLPSCSTCHAIYGSKLSEGEPSKIFFLFSREHTVSASAVDLFKKQAECLGLSEPFIFYNTTSELCPEDTKDSEEEQN